MKLEPCAERKKLEFGVIAAIQKTYIARQALRNAKTDKRADTGPFIVTLERARSKQREAEKLHLKHIEEHRCGSALALLAPVYEFNNFDTGR